MTFLLAFFTLLLAILFGMTGMGGGVAYTPLQLLFGIDFQTAATTSLFLIMMTSISASSIYLKQKQISWKLVIWLEVFTASGAFLGGYFSASVPEEILKALFSLFLIASGSIIILKKENHKKEIGRKKWYHITINNANNPININMLIAAPASIIAGVLAGMLGVGGGLFKLPLMISLLGIPLHIAVASSAVMVGITGGTGFIGRAITFGFNWRIGLAMGAAILIGARIGALYGSQINQTKLRRIIGGALILIGIILIVASFH